MKTRIALIIATTTLSCCCLFAQDEKRQTPADKAQPVQTEVITDRGQWLKVSISELTQLGGNEDLDYFYNVTVQRDGEKVRFLAQTPSSGKTVRGVSPTYFKILEITWMSAKAKDELTSSNGTGLLWALRLRAIAARDTFVHLKLKVLGKDDIEIPVAMLTSSSRSLVQMAIPKESVDDMMSL